MEVVTEDESAQNYSFSNTTILFDKRSELEKMNDNHLYYFLPSIIYTSTLMMTGATGNAVVLYVYFFKWVKSTSRIFILFLAGLDFLNCVTTLPTEIFIMRYHFMFDIPWLCKISRFGTYTMNSASAAILVGIAVDRYKRICRPYGSQFNAAQSKYICIICILCALSMTWPVLVLFGTRHVNLVTVVGSSCLLENKFDESLFPIIYFVIMMGSTLLIFTVLSIMYYFIGLQIYKLRIAKKKRLSATSGSIQKHTKNGQSVKARNTERFRKSVKQSAEEEQHEEVKCKYKNTLPTIHVQEYVESDSINGETTQESADCTEEIRKSTEHRQNEHISIQCNKKKLQERLSVDQTHCQHRPAIDEDDDYNDAAYPKCIKLNIRVGKTTLMLFLITLAYIISFFPYYIVAILRQSQPRFVNQLSDGGHMAYHLFLRSYQLSSAINPIIYSFCNAKFRSFTVGLFRRRSS